MSESQERRSSHCGRRVRTTILLALTLAIL